MSERPLSPHLQVYRPQLTSVLSIMHRGTGVALSVAALFVVYYLYAVAQGPGSHAVAQGMLDHWIGQLGLWAIVACTYYHLSNGIRHLVWDAGWGLEIDSAYQTGWAVVVFTVLATAATWFLFSGGAS